MLEVVLYTCTTNDPSYLPVLAAVATEQQARDAATIRLNNKNLPSIRPNNVNHTEIQPDFYMHPQNASFIKLQEGVDYKLLPNHDKGFISVEIYGTTHHWKNGYAI